jgi:acetolactate synthase-1/2/3 large subunit
LEEQFLKPENGIIRILKQEGTEFLSVMPVGNMVNPAHEEDLRIIMMRNERFAVALADGYSRASNGKKIGVFNVQGGTFPVGSEIAFGAVAQAMEDSSPILGLMNGPPLSQLGHNRFDITGLYGGITKWAAYVSESNRIPEFMRRAFTYLRTGRRGPVILNTASSRGPAVNWGEYDETEFPYLPVKGWKYPGDPRDVEVAVRALLAAKKPIIYAGQGIFYGALASGASLQNTSSATQTSYSASGRALHQAISNIISVVKVRSSSSVTSTNGTLTRGTSLTTRSLVTPNSCYSK